jgi:dienelactone hydrolase
LIRRPRIALASLFFLTLAVFASCDRAEQPSENANKNAAVPTLPSGPVEPGAPQRVTFTTADAAGVTIAGDLYLPDESPAPALLALHQWRADRSTYRDFARAMRDAGFVVLAIDGRGFGESTEGANGKVEPGWSTQEDIDAAIEFLKAQPSVDALRIGLVGASYGASNALIYAADNPEDVRAVALLSVGLNYNDSLPTEPAIKAYGDRPLLLVAARDDAGPAADTEKLAASVKSSKHVLQIYDAGGHGTSLLAPSVGGLDLVKAFFVKTLTGPIAERPAGEGATGESEPSEPAEGSGDEGGE